MKRLSVNHYHPMLPNGGWISHVTSTWLPVERSGAAAAAVAAAVLQNPALPWRVPHVVELNLTADGSEELLHAARANRQL